MFFVDIAGSNRLPLSSASAVVMAAIFAYSILKYELFDIKVQIFVRKTLIYSMTIAMVVALFIALIILFTLTVKELFTDYPLPFYIGGLIVSAILFKKFEKSSIKFVEKVFPKLKWKESDVGEIFLIHRDSGILISRVAINPKIRIDHDIVAGMLTAVQSFVGDILKPDEKKKMGLNVLSYGDVKLLIEHGVHSYIVVVFEGYEIEEMKKDVRKTMRFIDDNYSTLLKDWDGDKNKVRDIETLVYGMFK
jgi:hypothetical protein